MLFLLLWATPGWASIAAWGGRGTLPLGSAVVPFLHAAARTRWAARAVQGEIVSVWQVLDGTPSAPCTAAHRAAHCDDHCASNL